MSAIIRRPALVQVPINANVAGAQQKTGSGSKRSREDDPEDPMATRSSAKRIRLDATPPMASQIPSVQLTACTPDSTVIFNDKSKDLGATKRLDVVKDARSDKKSRADREKARASKLEAEENFRIRYRSAFPHWKFYFDGVPLGAVNVATRKIEQLGAVVEGFLSKEVTHLIIPVKVENDKENDTQHKPLSISHPLGTLRSPFDLKTGYNPVDRAREWGCKIWDITKLESVLERTLARPTPAKPEVPASSLKGLLSLEKTHNAVSTKSSAIAARPAPVPLFKAKTQNPFNINTAVHRKLPPPFHPIGSAITTGMPRDRKLNPASRALVGLLKTEKATNTTMERDPRCQRHDYTYFSKLSAFLIVETVQNDLQMVGRLEYKAKSMSTAPRLISYDSKGVFNIAHRGPSGKELPEYPLLHLDSRMRSPFQPYTARGGHKEQLLEQKERKDKEAREKLIRFWRAHKRAMAENRLKKTMSMSDLKVAKAMATAAHHHAHVQWMERDRASGFIRSTAGTGAFGSMASGSVNSLSTAFTGGSGYPPATSHHTTSFSLSQSGGANSWAKLHGAGGVVPGFGGVRKATHVMNRGAFAENSTAAAAGGATRSRTTSLSRMVSLTGAPIRAEQKATAAATTATAANGTLRRTQSMMAIKPAKEVEIEKKKPEGYCECCKEQFDSLAEHIKSKRHRKFAADPARYKELDRAIRKLGRVTKKARQIADEELAPARAAARERYFRRMRDLIASTLATGDGQPSPQNLPPAPEKAHEPERTTPAASDEDPDRTISSSLGLDVLEATGLILTFDARLEA